MQQDMLAKLSDSELQELKAQADALLKSRDEDRKAKALAGARALKAKAEAEARKLLESVGLSVKDFAGKRRRKARYTGGKLYRHPTQSGLVWNARGQKPGWLRDLEGAGGKAVEVEQAENKTARG